MSEVRRRGVLRLLVSALLLSVAGCQVPAARAQPGPSVTSPGQDRRVAAADARLVAGDYDGADAAYRALAEARVPGGASHLSTLLAYENRFPEAVAAAQQGVDLSADADSLARLTRALDWSEQVDAAVAAGARAVAARPTTALAHTFYSEALADSGQFAASVHQLELAESLPGDRHVQAEIDREWSNYYRALGDIQSELNYTELAIRAEPGFPERQLDLIRYEYGDQRTGAARTLADRLLAAHPKNYRLLLAAADAALSGGDTVRASSLYQAAAAIHADSAEAALGQAELAVAVSHDFAAAHDMVLQALRQNPGSAALYQYVRYLDLLLLGRDAAPDLAPLDPQPPPDVAAGRKTLLDHVNTIRSSLGLAAIREDPALDEAATAHAYYLLFNAGQQTTGADVSAEEASLPGFIGAAVLDRDRHFGYAGSRAAELVSNRFTPAGDAEGWLDGVFHRVPLLDRQTTSIGFGQAGLGPLVYAAADVGVAAPAAGDPVMYPAANQRGVPAAFTGNEVPDPLPRDALTPTGYPITLQVGDSQKLAIGSGRLFGPDRKEVPSYTLGPGAPLGDGQWVLIPERPLGQGTYSVEVTGTVDGQNLTESWSFTVGP